MKDRHLRLENRKLPPKPRPQMKKTFWLRRAGIAGFVLAVAIFACGCPQHTPVRKEPKTTPCEASIDKANSSIAGSAELLVGTTENYTAMIAYACKACVVEQGGVESKVSCDPKVTYQWSYKSSPSGHVSIKQDLKDLTKNRVVEITGATKGGVVLQVYVGLTCQSTNEDCKDNTSAQIIKELDVK
jgi:hypothetical protein